ncbi:hypothetical protein EDD18DRAFT_1333613 [Armillaria luteobubalina]|uniref:Uncharacterized protein n=1 Tax=Armillaria luteobubalina TaxID=153913 RepID=A0AA39Q0K3_9AGAR|nr:hypothetical protein EDD18DRAFT_1333613 [Armillaria luteobubalina]
MTIAKLRYYVGLMKPSMIHELPEALQGLGGPDDDPLTSRAFEGDTPTVDQRYLPTDTAFATTRLRFRCTPPPFPELQGSIKTIHSIYESTKTHRTSRGRSTTFGFQVRTAYDPVERRTDSEASLYIDARNTARKFDAQDWEATWYRRQRDPRLPIRSREVVEHKSRVPTGRMVGIELVVQALQILQTYHTRAAIYSNERDVQTERSEIEWSSTL